MNEEKRKQQSKRRIKVMHVLKSFIYSGAENVVFTIMHGLQEQVDFLYVATEGTIRNKLEEERLNFRLVPVFNRSELSKAIKEFQPDIVHAHDFSATVLCATIPGRFRLISHLHYDPPWVQRWSLKTIIYSMCYPRISKLIAVSEKTYSNMAFSGVYQTKRQIMPNPIDEDRIRQRAEVVIPELQDKSCDLIFIGRLVEQKNPQRFIQLVHQVKERGFSNIHAWMLGDGELRADCENLIHELGLDGQITMYGFCENPYPYLKHSRILCMTSRWEGFGLVAIEANTLGVPVLSTPTSGCTEVLGEGAEELCETDEAFVSGTIKMLKEEKIYDKNRIGALKRAMIYDNKEVYMNGLHQLYQTVTTGK